jgi:hypothetical protein
MGTTALVATVLLVVLTLFQLGLAAGAPWGAAAYGGGWTGVLPKGMRINSLVFGLVIYPLIILYVLDAGEVISSGWLPGSRTVAMWVLVAFFGIGSIANFASRSKVERWWGPVALVVGICCAVLAVG